MLIIVNDPGKVTVVHNRCNLCHQNYPIFLFNLTPLDHGIINLMHIL